MSRIQITSVCRAPGCGAIVRAAADATSPSPTPCPQCGVNALPNAAADWRRENRVESCPCCGGAEFFLRKDFPQKLGLAIVIVAALISMVLYARHTLAAFGVLAGVVVLDAMIYLLVRWVTVCYRCRAEFRGAAYNPRHSGFDLATAEKYPKPGTLDPAP